MAKPNRSLDRPGIEDQNHAVNKVTISTIAFVLSLTFLWIYLNRDHASLLLYLVDLPIFVLFYGLMFTIPIQTVSQGIRYGTRNSMLATIGFPIVLVVLYYLYLFVHQQPVLQGANLLLPYLLLFPVMAFYRRSAYYKEISWFDLVVVLAFLWPVTLIDLPGSSDLPIDGVHFDSVYRMVILLVGVYSFVVIRRLRDVGFWIDVSGRKLWTTVWVWGVYIGIVWLVGALLGVIQFNGSDDLRSYDFDGLIARFLTIFLHTALFEELFFRGFMQNMLSKKIRQSANPLVFWLISTLLMLILALVTGVIMGGNMWWFPVLISVLLLMTAYLMSNFFTGYRHHYLALAVVSILFGLVHFHAGSLVFVGMAMLAGWAYGYVYWKTRSVLYAALIHTLVNFSPLLLGIELLN